MKKIPSYEEARAELGDDAMSFLMDMVDQNETPTDREEHDKTDEVLPKPASVDEARTLPSGSHFIDPKGRRRKTV